MKKILPVLLVVVAIVVILKSCSGLGETKDSNGRDETWARTVAQDIVSDRLKSPSSASFSWPNETTVSLSNDTWTVSGWVDSKNGFGSTIRSNYTVKFESSSKSEYAYTIILCRIT